LNVYANWIRSMWKRKSSSLLSGYGRVLIAFHTLSFSLSSACFSSSPWDIYVYCVFTGTIYMATTITIGNNIMLTVLFLFLLIIVLRKNSLNRYSWIIIHSVQSCTKSLITYIILCLYSYYAIKAHNSINILTLR